MNQKLSWLVGIMMMSTAINAQANIIVTPYIGYTGGGQVEDESGNTYDLDPAVNYALSVETPLEKGRIGLFYSNQSTELEKLSNSADIHYLHFQSSMYYPVAEKWQTYIGVGLGASYADVDWVDKKYGFSASAFA
ncbi:porin family protein, partial [Vibrio parahaemolyticus]|nr:porin family protein [Vibrio parahaemolyticus]